MQHIEELTVFCKNVTFLREKHQLSKKDMAQRLHMSRYTLNRIERGIVSERMGTNVLFYIYQNFGVLPGILPGRILTSEDEQQG